MRVLVVEDEERMADLLRRALEEEGHAVDLARDGPDGVWLATENPYGAIVLDVMLPGFDGFEVCRRLRAAEIWVPVLMLTARDEVGDRVRGLDSGADDYLVKPFDFAELVARLQALQRRPALRFNDEIRCGDLQFDSATRELRGAGKEIELTSTERLLIELLLRRSPAAVSRRTIAHQVWDDQADVVGSNMIEVHIARIRSKLAACETKIETIRGFGYRVVAPRSRLTEFSVRAKRRR
jgi:two-component system OmpR family response regulator